MSEQWKQHVSNRFPAVLWPRSNIHGRLVTFSCLLQNLGVTRRSILMLIFFRDAQDPRLAKLSLPQWLSFVEVAGCCQLGLRLKRTLARVRGESFGFDDAEAWQPGFFFKFRCRACRRMRNESILNTTLLPKKKSKGSSNICRGSVSGSWIVLTLNQILNTQRDIPWAPCSERRLACGIPALQGGSEWSCPWQSQFSM